MGRAACLHDPQLLSCGNPGAAGFGGRAALRPAKPRGGGAPGFERLGGVKINQIPADKSIGSMMLSGELEAVIHYIVNPNLIDRSTADLWHHPQIKPLFTDPAAEGGRYYRKT